MTHPPTPPVPTPPVPPVRPGQTITVGESDFMYGAGVLVLRVSEVGGLRTHDGDAWLAVRGMQLRGNGVEVGERTALVRLSALADGQPSTTPPDGAA